MERTTKQSKTNATPSFAIEIKDDTELGLATLIAEDEEGHYEPVGVAVSISLPRLRREGGAGQMSDEIRQAFKIAALRKNLRRARRFGMGSTAIAAFAWAVALWGWLR